MDFFGALTTNMSIILPRTRLRIPLRTIIYYLYRVCQLKDGVWLDVDSKNGHQNDMSKKEIGLRAQNVLTILGSTVNIVGGLVCSIH